MFDGIKLMEDYPSILRKKVFKDLLKLKLQPTRIFS